jgi:hypothetical protein
MPIDDEVARYREAAQLTLKQLDWCVVYLHSIRKTQLARALAENSSAIARSLSEAETGPSRPPEGRARRGL